MHDEENRKLPHKEPRSEINVHAARIAGKRQEWIDAHQTRYFEVEQIESLLALLGGKWELTGIEDGVAHFRRL